MNNERSMGSIDSDWRKLYSLNKNKFSVPYEINNFFMNFWKQTFIIEHKAFLGANNDNLDTIPQIKSNKPDF